MYKDTYEDLSRLMCYNHVVYDADRTSASVETLCRQHASITDVTYSYDGQDFAAANTFHADTSLHGDLTTVVKGKDKDMNEYKITLEPTNFIW